MGYLRYATVCFLAGILLIPIGYVISPPFHISVYCSTTGFRFVGIRWFTIIWYDDCDKHFFPLLSLLGSVSFIAATGFGIAEVVKHLR